MRAYEFITEGAQQSANKSRLNKTIANLTINDVPKPFIDAFKERGITNPNTITAYYKVAGKETKALGGPENMDYSTTPNKRIVKLFGEPNSWRGTNKSNPNNLNYLPPEKLDWLKSDPQRFGQFLYGGQRAKIVPDAKQGYRMEFSKPEDQQRANDGWNYRGRGHVQITGRDQYAKISQELYGDDRLVKNPDLVNDPSVGLRASAAYAKLYGNAHKDQSANATDSLNRALVTVGGSAEKYKPGGRMYQQQIDGINTFAQNLADPKFKQQHDQHYASVNLANTQATKPPSTTTPATQVAKTEPGMLDRLKSFGQEVGQNIGNVLIKPAQAGTTPSFAPGSQGLHIPSTGSNDTKASTDSTTQAKPIK
jgi:predicted chitinase